MPFNLLGGYVGHTLAYNFARVSREPVDINHILQVNQHRSDPCSLGLRAHSLCVS